MSRLQLQWKRLSPSFAIRDSKLKVFAFWTVVRTVTSLFINAVLVCENILVPNISNNYQSYHEEKDIEWFSKSGFSLKLLHDYFCKPMTIANLITNNGCSNMENKQKGNKKMKLLWCSEEQREILRHQILHSSVVKLSMWSSCEFVPRRTNNSRILSEYPAYRIERNNTKSLIRWLSLHKFFMALSDSRCLSQTRVGGVWLRHAQKMFLLHEKRSFNEYEWLAVPKLYFFYETTISIENSIQYCIKIFWLWSRCRSLEQIIYGPIS